ncbi:MAG: hypothetical protein ACFFAH_15760 [Promethearchaeota archaeon]
MSNCSRVLAASPRFAPSLAHAIAICRPMPLPAPVIIIFLPFNNIFKNPLKVNLEII